MQTIGFPPLDSDHLFLAEMLEDLARAAATIRNAELLEDQSLEVTASLESHFAKEERMLAETNDPNAQPHIRRHGELLERMASLTGEKLFAMGPLAAEKCIREFQDDLAQEVVVFDLPAAPAILSLQKS
jgi:hemerythrin-like metal-binding protein